MSYIETSEKETFKSDNIGVFRSKNFVGERDLREHRAKHDDFHGFLTRCFFLLPVCNVRFAFFRGPMLYLEKKNIICAVL